MTNKYYKQLIFTNHALKRMRDRSISPDAIWRVLQHPDRVQQEDKPGSSRFIRTLSGRQYQVVGTYLPKEKRTLIISVWVRGEEDRQPLLWALLTLPIRALWWLARLLWRIVAKLFER